MRLDDSVCKEKKIRLFDQILSTLEPEPNFQHLYNVCEQKTDFAHRVSDHSGAPIEV